ncbi:MAG: envelope stress response membrane protein PspC [Gammaproteobacteria bacterium]|nr:envelope stress response membrane protein PspC [Gammaproteobacteria bacterium]
MKRSRQRFDDDYDDVAAAYRSMRKRRRSRGLHRDTERGILGGVCAGVAKYLGVEPWIIRVAFVAIVLLGGGWIPLIVYIVLVFVLDPEPAYAGDWDEPDEEAEDRSPYTAIRSSPRLGLRVVSADVRELELRLRRMERYVTSPKYDLDKGFSDMGRH